jgi:hypothetical protein
VLVIRELLGVIEELSPWLVVRARKTLQNAEKLLRNLPYEVATE